MWLCLFAKGEKGVNVDLFKSRIGYFLKFECKDTWTKCFVQGEKLFDAYSVFALVFNEFTCVGGDIIVCLSCAFGKS